jgi:ATP phosphoribosyltransferase regulatory subunit
MTTSNRWLLPEGIEELLPTQAEHLETLRRELLDLFRSWGYELVTPPLIEYLESLLVGAAYDLVLETFTLTDQLSGRLMGIRADMTPQVARIDAHHFKLDAPVRLCYLGTVLRTRPDGFIRTRSPMQVGAELYGHSGVESDGEVLCLMTEMLDAVGLTDVHIDLGHVGIYRALVRQAGLDAAVEEQLFRYMQRKAKPDIEQFLSGSAIDKSVRSMLISLVDMNGGGEVLDEARGVLKSASKDVHAALENLLQVAAQVRQRNPSVSIWYDLAELRGYRYQTGVVFAAYVAGHGQEVARGGRYDDIGREYGRARPATGFSADLKTLMAVTLAPPTVQPSAILAPWSDDDGLGRLIRELRSQGERVIYRLPNQSGAEIDIGCDRVIKQIDGRWVVKAIK